MKSLKQITTINIPALSGEKCIAEAKDTFAYIDSDFKNWKLDKKSEDTSEETTACNLSVYELVKDGTYKDIFTSPKEQCLTQEQIIEFCQNNKSSLSDNCTLFLFEVNDEFFVAHVNVRADGLRVDVIRFGPARVWFAENRDRVVTPATDSLNLNTSDTLSLETLDHYSHIVEWLYLNDGQFGTGKKWREEFLKELKKCLK